MSNFKSKLLGLAGLAVVFAGASYGQVITACNTGVASSTGPRSVRAEGTNELTADFQFTCTEPVPTAVTGSVQIFTSAPVTSKVINTTTLATEATLFVCAVTADCTAITGDALVLAHPLSGTVVAYSGVATASGVSFPSVNFPATATFGLHVSNIRVNASAITVGATLTGVTAQGFVTASGTSVSTGTATTVAYVLKSLSAPGLVTNPNGGTSATVTSYTSCAGNPLSSTTPLLISFLVQVSESGQGGFFKLKNSGTVGAAFESGSYTGTAPGGTGIGTSDFGTRIQLAFANVPSAATLYLPTVITVNHTLPTSTFQLTLVSGPTSGSVASPGITASTATGAPGAGTSGGATSFAVPANYSETYAASAAFTPTNNTVTAVYEVAATDDAVIELADIPVFVSFAAGAFTTPQGAITVVVGYAPQAAAAAATTVPNFAPVIAPVLNGTTVGVCNTNLLFPFVTSSLGFDTGIAIANTSADPFGTTLSPGSCTLNFYGTGAPTPSTGVAAPGGSQAGGTSTTFLLSNVAAGFTGYMIAQCSYQYGHGFAYITYGFGQSQATAMGYVANVLSRGTNSTAEVLSH